MKKIGILTLNGNFNVGNRLQNYALKKVLEKFDANVETIWFTGVKDSFERNLKKVIFKIINNKKKINFNKFSRDYLNIKYIYNKSKLSDKYDYIVVGSDQVWNYNFPDFNDDMFLKFSPKEKNISYAASIGVDTIKDQYKNIFIDGLKNINFISVREEKAKEIVEELLPDREATVVVDPTMLLSNEEWSKVSKKPKNFTNQKFIFTYFLGEVSNERREKLIKFSSENNYEIIDMLDKNSVYYNCGPSEFLYLEKNASLICTDSFHSSVFALIFNTPLIIYDREDNEEKMNSRIDTLINKFKLKNVRYDGNLSLNQIKQDYSYIQRKIEIEKDKSFDFLKKSIIIKK